MRIAIVTLARSYKADGNIEYLDRIKEWMQLWSERTRIPSLKSYNQKKLKEKTKEVNDILRLIHKNNITETICSLQADYRTRK